MPTLNWIGKDAVVNHHHQVPFRVLEKKYDFGDADSGNKIIHGDNLEALKSLLPEYEGKIKCIYIDPPYNTGNENWVYNDNVNSPKIKKWLGEVVGKEAEDLSRHDKWLCMMYPRLQLLHKLLSEEGAIFISIDDNELANLKLLCDEIFSYSNYIGCISRATGTTTGQDANKIGSSLDYCLVYSKSSNFKLNGLDLDEKDKKRFNCKDEKGLYSILQLRKTGSADTKQDRPKMFYPVIAPDGTEVFPFGPTNYLSRWRVSKDTYLDWEKQGLIEWKRTSKIENIEVDGFKKSSWTPYVKYYLEGRTKQVPNLWTDIEGNKKASLSIKDIFGEKNVFDTPKPIEFLTRILQISTTSDSIVLDSFAGSGTTAHSVLNINKQDGGNRKFILVEMEDYADTVTAERVRRVTNGYGEGNSAVEGTGGGFSFYELGKPIFKEDKNLNEEIGEDHIREYVFYSETHQHLSRKRSPESKYLLDTFEDVGYYFYYEPDAITTLGYDTLNIVSERASQYIIYADKCLLSKDELLKMSIIFKKIPRDIQRF